MDWASLIGLCLGLLGVLVGQGLEGGHLSSLLQPAAFAIVVIGTMGAVLLQSGMRNFTRGIRMLAWIFRTPPNFGEDMSSQITVWSSLARREGLLSLEKHIDEVEDPFTVKGLRMIVDGIDSGKMRHILEADISTFERRERQAAKIWEAAGGYAPTIGILGAVLGLIHVMENLADPSKLGSGIAVAFVATIYGVGFANLIFLPIANKLKTVVADEVFRREMLTDLFCSISAGDNSRVVEERLLSYQ